MSNQPEENEGIKIAQANTIAAKKYAAVVPTACQKRENEGRRKEQRR